jgi:hypothetical protein
MADREDKVGNLTSSPERNQAYERMRARYQNKAVSAMVKNLTTPNRIVEYDGKLIQKMYSIYLDDHKPKHSFDFSAILFQPTKHFLGYQWDTYYFNIFIIWAMTLFLYIALYFDLLRKFIQLFEQRKLRRRDRS